jgi:hypothetical protein
MLGLKSNKKTQVVQQDKDWLSKKSKYKIIMEIHNNQLL